MGLDLDRTCFCRPLWDVSPSLVHMIARNMLHITRLLLQFCNTLLQFCYTAASGTTRNGHFPLLPSPPLEA